MRIVQKVLVFRQVAWSNYDSQTAPLPATRIRRMPLKGDLRAFLKEKTWSHDAP